MILSYLCKKFFKLNVSESNTSTHLLRFKKPIEHLALPEKFTFPFYYEPHALSKIAAQELQDYLLNKAEWEHNFGLEKNQEGLVIGKMFGVLVVREQNGTLGYLAAFSGKLANQNHHAFFVPPVFDILTEDGFFRKEEEILNQINQKIEVLEHDKTFLLAKKQVETLKIKFEQELSRLKLEIKENKKKRDHLRQSSNLNEEQVEQLRLESIKEQYFLKDRTKFWKEEISKAEKIVQNFQTKITQLKEERKFKSNNLQQQLFGEYYFLNQAGKKKSLGEIFKDSAEKRPPAGAGECAAPKLLHFAFQHNLKPIALAEFWWGQSPKSEVRVHQHFYPACRGKCEPILAHMLEGIELDENPMLTNPAEGKNIEIVYEDEFMLVVNKPAEFLSVPGITIQDSVYERIKSLYPTATGPLLVHRLDMSTSGILLIAKNKVVHKQLQSQFIRRKISKRYVALLDGIFEKDSGIIDLPLRVDLDDRPRQLVCYEYGKTAQTKWEVIERKDGKTKVYFYPITGRTHQLRVHAAHSLGLNTPIVGDDLYGTKAHRLHLHAEQVVFRHPVSNEEMKIEVEAEF
jgi:tRNA pseudouridine32 synthase / 23S rRNA pseudouridine746 synthase